VSAAEPLLPTDIWTADGRKVHSPRRGGLPFGVPTAALGALAFAPVAVGVLAASAAVTAGVVAVGVASAATRSLLGQGPRPFAVGLRFHDAGVDVMVVRVDPAGAQRSDPAH
jgi:hypothetical protein